METSLLLFLELTVLGIIYIIVSFLESRIIYTEFKSFSVFKSISILLFVTGILVHTLGDVLGGGTDLEMQLETVGHFVIMIGGIILIQQSLNLFKLAEEYGYG